MCAQYPSPERLIVISKQGQQVAPLERDERAFDSQLREQGVEVGGWQVVDPLTLDQVQGGGGHTTETAWKLFWIILKACFDIYS